MKKEASICITSRLSEEQKKEILALGRACRAWEPIGQEPFVDQEENADPSFPCFYIYYENTFPISFLSIFMPDGSYGEVTGFTLPGYRQKGHFKELLECARKELQERGMNVPLYLVCDGQGPDAEAVLSHWQLQPEYSEMMMAAPLHILSDLISACSQAESLRVEKQGEEYVLLGEKEWFGRCRLAFFSGTGTAYLYGFEIRQEVRRQGYGRLFLKKLSEMLLSEGEVHTMLLQVGSRNEAACGLYRSCGFEVTEQLSYYLL